MDQCAKKVWNNLPMHLAGIRHLILCCSPPFPWFPTFVLILRNMLMRRSPGLSQEGAAPLQNKSPFFSTPHPPHTEAPLPLTRIHPVLNNQEGEGPSTDSKYKPWSSACREYCVSWKDTALRASLCGQRGGYQRGQHLVMP